MTALVLSEVFPPQVGGSGKWLNDIYSRMDENRTVLLVGKHNHSDMFDASTPLSIVRDNLTSSVWTLMSKQGRAYFYRFYKRAKTIGEERKIKEVHCGRVIPEGVVGLALKYRLRIGLVCYVHGEDIELATKSREMRWIVSMVIRCSDRLVCNSQNTAKLLIDKWTCDSEKVVVINPGVDTERFEPALDKNHLKKDLGFEGSTVLITVGRLERRKGHDVMLEVMNSLIRVDNSLVYIIVGTGLELVPLKRRVNELRLDKFVIFTGEVDDKDLMNYLQMSDIFVLPNRTEGTSIEGFGIVLLEAQACGIPVIAGDSGGTVETMNDGETGYIVDCTDPKILEDCVSRLLLDIDLRLRMGTAARLLMEQKFDWKVIINKVKSSVFIDR